jgi:hypothetical protein
MGQKSGDRQHKSRTRGDELKRQRVTSEAARIMAEEGVRDFQTAKRKAAERLGLSDHRHLPRNEEIEQALTQHLQLFHRHELSENRQRLRAIAADAMRFLAAYDPRLVGPVLSGTITSTSEIQLHLAADSPEEIGWFLQEHDIPYEQGERRIRFGGDRYEPIATYRFSADGAVIELCVFDPRSARETPLSPVDGRPMRRANLKELETLAQQPTSTPFT